jgi:hypothetical protein
MAGVVVPTLLSLLLSKMGVLNTVVVAISSFIVGVVLLAGVPNVRVPDIVVERGDVSTFAIKLGNV